jgi:hypothetical protein
MIYGTFSGCPTLGGNSTWLLTFNEPYGTLSPDQAARLWRQLELCYPQKLLVSPATVRFDDYDDSRWLTSMRNAYIARYHHPPRFDALAFHCYSSRSNPLDTICRQQADTFKALAHDWRLSDRLWVTEFASVTDSQDGMLHWLRRTLTWMRSDPNIAFYAYFAGRYKGDEHWAWGTTKNTSLVNCTTDTLTPLGQAYRQLGATPQ